MVIVTGEILMLRSAKTRNGKPYHQVKIKDQFIFWWSDGDSKGFEEGQDVEIDYTPGKFCTLKSIKKINIGKSAMLSVKYGEFLKFVKMIKEIEHVLVEKWVAENNPSINVNDMIETLIKSGEIYKKKPGLYEVLE